ncbi:hypothetical protein PTKIN_Ptkin01aG0134400 [Pterospermum kingtungense]
MQFWDDFKARNTTSQTKFVSVLKGWSPPPQRCVKLNVDAGFSSIDRYASGGTVMRDANKDIIFSTVVASVMLLPRC